MQETTPLVSLEIDRPVWDRFYTVAPLYVIGTRGPDGTPDLAPKHLAPPSVGITFSVLSARKPTPPFATSNAMKSLP
jgi:hypothetical protein